jgi:putative salt-induced outer membrane protein YdiY
MRRANLLLLVIVGPLLAETAGAQDPPPPPPVIVEAAPPPPPKVWCGGLEFGVNGSDGNSENFKLRFAGNAKRTTPDNVFTTDWRYGFATADGIQTENRFLLNARDEFLFADSPWNLFVSSIVDVDEFKAYDLRLAAHAGVGYQFVKNDVAALKGRLGFGGSREIGGPNNRFMPELLIGADFERKLTARSKFTSTAEVYPDVTDLGDYWAQIKAAYEVLIDPEWNLTLKLGALNRYDSTPEGRKRNDLEYFAVLLWKY